MVVESYKYRINVLNRNWLGIICGETGSGKSYSALKLSELIDPEFDIDRVIFTPEEFFEILNSGKLHKGNALIWDEVGVGLPAREFYTVTNRDVNYVLQTFRHENLAVLFTTPGFSFVDVQARRLNINKPSDDLANAYEKKAKQYKERLKKEKEREILFEKQRKRGGKIDIDKIVEEISNNLEKFQKDVRDRTIIDEYSIMAEFDIGWPTSRKIRTILERRMRKRT